MRIERGNYCMYFNFENPDPRKKLSRFKCYNPKAIRKNGNFRIINRKLAFSGKFPKWCPLENWPEKYGNTF